jgi:BASS family bile acid:Na+ symporter
MQCQHDWMLEATDSQNTPSEALANPALAVESRIARVAVTVFPLLVVAAGIVGYLAPGVFKPMAPSVPYLLGIIMFCMGLTLTPPDFAAVAKRPWAVALGIVAHYVIMPGAGWLIAAALHLEPELAVGLILVGCAPSGTASNVMAFLAKGDVALSVAVASVSTLIAPVVTPLLVLFLAGSYLQIDAAGMVLDIAKTVLLPVIAGLLARLFLKKLVGEGPAGTSLGLRRRDFPDRGHCGGRQCQQDRGGRRHCVPGRGAAQRVRAGAGLPRRQARAAGHKARRALAFEVGMQNSGLAATLATAHFSPLAALPSAVFSLWHNISGAIVAAWLARRPLGDAKG